MNASNRQTLIKRVFTVLKKHYQSVRPPADRPVLEHLLYACCLENARHEQVDEVFARLEQDYFDWNEIRVTTVTELAEVMSNIADAPDAARRLKRVLQSVFETHYSFDLEFLRKENLGKAIKEIEKYNGVTPFAVAYVTQCALGGHAIPVNQGVLNAFQILGVISESEAASGRVPGLERAIAKSQGVEFGSLVHQLGVAFQQHPYSPQIRSLLLEIEPEAKSRLPKRPTRKKKAAAEKGSAKPAKRKKKSDSASTSSKKKKKKSNGEAPPTAAAKRRKASSSKSTKGASATKRLARKKPR